MKKIKHIVFWDGEKNKEIELISKNEMLTMCCADVVLNLNWLEGERLWNFAKDHNVIFEDNENLRILNDMDKPTMKILRKSKIILFNSDSYEAIAIVDFDLFDGLFCQNGFEIKKLTIEEHEAFLKNKMEI